MVTIEIFFIFQYERFIQPESTVAASMYAPIMYSPCPVLCFRQKASGTLVSSKVTFSKKIKFKLHFY